MNNPNIEVIKPKQTGLFTNYIYKTIPLAFDESLSYYETLCGILGYLKQTILPAIDNNADALAEVQQLYIDLKNYVDNYFKNLDVQGQLNNILQQEIENGKLQVLLNYNASDESLNLTVTRSDE